MRSIALAFILVGLVFAGMGYGTWAVYQDTETSSGNYVQAGTLNLVLTDGVLNADSQWVITNGYPGQPGLTGGDGQIKIYNVGDVDAGNVKVWFTFDCYEDDNGNPDDGANSGPESDTDQTGVGDWLKEIKVTRIRYSGDDALSDPNIDIVNDNGNQWDSNYVQDLNGNGYIDLHDLANQVITGLYPPETEGNPSTLEGYTAFELDFQIIDTGSPQNDWQGDYCIMTVHVTLEQEP